MKIIGHRGAKGLAPENTLASFKKALEHHVDELEFDLRVTKDGVVVLNHNSSITDPAGNQLLIKDCTLNELQKHKPDLLTFEEFIAKIGCPVKLLVEIKPHENTKPIIKILRQQLDNGWKPSDFSIGSFDQAILRDMHREFPDVAMIVIENWSGVRASWRARQVGAKRINMLEYWLWSGFIKAMSKDYQLYTFPPKKNRPLARLLLGERTNNPSRIRKWEKYGLAGVITDYPDRFEK